MEDKNSLDKALESAGLAVRPKKMTEKSTPYWLKAICRVYKSNGVYSYCLCENVDGKCVIKRDFGPMAAIVRIEDIFPYEVLEKRFIPKLRTDREIERYLIKSDVPAEQIKVLMSKENKTNEEISADRKTLKEMVMNIAMADAVKMLAEEARCKTISEYGERTDKED